MTTRVSVSFEGLKKFVRVEPGSGYAAFRAAVARKLALPAGVAASFSLRRRATGIAVDTDFGVARLEDGDVLEVVAGPGRGADVEMNGGGGGGDGGDGGGGIAEGKYGGGYEGGGYGGGGGGGGG
eukprot:g4560.t1